MSNVILGSPDEPAPISRSPEPSKVRLASASSSVVVEPTVTNSFAVALFSAVTAPDAAAAHFIPVASLLSAVSTWLLLPTVLIAIEPVPEPATNPPLAIADISASIPPTSCLKVPSLAVIACTATGAPEPSATTILPSVAPTSPVPP